MSAGAHCVWGCSQDKSRIRAWAFSERGRSLRVGLLTGQEPYTYVRSKITNPIRSSSTFHVAKRACVRSVSVTTFTLPRLFDLLQFQSSQITRFVPVRIFPNYPICSSPKVSKLRTYSIWPSSNLPKLRTYVFDLCVRAYVRDCEHVRWRSPERVWWPHRHTMFRLATRVSLIP